MTARALVALLFIHQADTVLLLGSPDPTWAPLEEQIAAELQASGFTVERVASELDAGGDVPTQLWQRAQARSALAVLWLHPRADKRIDAWVADRATGKAMLRTYDAPTSSAQRARLALQAVELLHASLLEVQLMTKPEQAAVPEVAREAAERRYAEAPRRPHLIFGTGAGVVFSSGARQPQPMLELQVGWAFSALVSAEAQVLTSVFPAQVAYGSSTADVGIALFRLMVALTPLRAGPFLGSVVAATGAALVWAQGHATDPHLEERLDSQATWVLGGGLAFAWRFNEGVRLQLVGTAGAGVPAVAVDFAGTTRGVLLRPEVDAMLRLEFE